MNSEGEAAKAAAADAKQVEVESLLKKEFGPEYNKRLDQAKRLAIDTLGSNILNDTILKDGSRLGDNPDVIKAFSMLADKLSEDEIIKGDGVGYMTASQLEKEIAELKTDVKYIREDIGIMQKQVRDLNKHTNMGLGGIKVLLIAGAIVGGIWTMMKIFAGMK